MTHDTREAARAKTGAPARRRERLFDGADWNFATLRRIYDACEEIALGELGLDVYPNQIEVITAEQMLDAYSSIGMPLFYKHWSFGKHFAHHEAFYRKGIKGLAYEIVINSSPCISYLMEENTATMQALVIAHAAFGHNHFFKNNELFKQWTDADGILDYLSFAKTYIARCEERHGEAAVERTLDAAHALMSHGVHRYPSKKKLDLRDDEKRERERRIHEEQVFNDLWRATVPSGPSKSAGEVSIERRRKLLGLPQDNILYFLEKSAPRLQPWQRELLRIVRHVAQYFYPQGQTKVMNEGTATYVHYRIMTQLHDEGAIDDGSFLEFIRSHTNVVFQPSFDDPRFAGFNPYALGFAMMQDIERIVSDPTDEDREWFPDIAGRGDVMGVLRDVWSNYRDESFISQFLSPRLIRQMRMFHIHDDPAFTEGIRVAAIHDERGYRRIRRELSRQYDVGWIDPNIEVVDVDLAGDRRLVLHHTVVHGTLLDETDVKRVLQHLADLWTYDVMLREVDASDRVLKEHFASPRQPVLATLAQ
jgi:stage V sporulation protein R